MKLLFKIFTMMPVFVTLSVASAGGGIIDGKSYSTVSYGYLQKGTVYLQTYDSGDNFYAISKQAIVEQGIDPLNLINQAVKGSLTIKCSNVLKISKTVSSCVEPEFNDGLDRRDRRGGE